ncbi:unnamed protein product [Ceutorhynchus assimilis]|uniref:Uncharacterized protein n=1 Tax=Ceutorhynchus assimilis TaxID=467358 RepID=A0A9N9MRS7_9CUCU|nr:unnamed protein product [Ceutorhynchus assimilis]
MFYISFKFCYFNASLTRVARKHKLVETYTEANAKVLLELFKFTKQHVNGLLMKYKTLHKKETAELIESYQLCQKMGFTKEDLLKYPRLFLYHPVINYHHSCLFKDAGIKKIDAPLLCRSKFYLRNKISTFKEQKYLQPDENIVDNLLSCLKPSIEKPNKLNEALEDIDEKSLTQIHETILIDWLKTKLKITNEDLSKLLRIHKMIKNKSFTVINENIALAKSVGLKKPKILKCGYLLNNYPEYPKTMLQDSPHFAGVDFAKAYKNNPKLMMINPRKIKEIYAILKEHEVPDEMIRNKPNVFTLSPITLKKRLGAIKNTPEFEVFSKDPQMLTLVLGYEKAVTRLSFLKKLKLRCTSLSHINLPDADSFLDYIQEGKDINSTHSAVKFFSTLLDKTRQDVYKILRKHPYYNCVPFLDIERTFQYLKMAGYTKDNIARSLLILLYPDSKVHLVMNQLREDEYLQFGNLSQHKQLQLVLYRIEKEYHFTGKGIWSNIVKTDQMDEKLLE